MAASSLKGFRRVAVVFIVVSLAIAALFGIVTVLTGEFGDLQGKILLTTLLLAGSSITALCHLAVVDRSLRVVGLVGIAVSASAFVAGAVLIWRDWSQWSAVWDVTLKVFAVLAIAAVSIAHASLILLLGDRRNRSVRIALVATVVLLSLVALMIVLPIVSDGRIPGDNEEAYWRVFGVFAILDVLGTIVLPVVARLTREGVSATSVRVNGEAAVILGRAAQERGKTPEQLVEELIMSLEFAPPAS